MTPAQRQQLKRDRRKAGLALLSQWVPADKLQACRAAIDEITARETNSGQATKQETEMTYPPDDQAADLADAILKAAGSGLSYYSLPGIRNAILNAAKGQIIALLSAPRPTRKVEIMVHSDEAIWVGEDDVFDEGLGIVTIEPHSGQK